MNSSGKNYTELYSLQDSVFKTLKRNTYGFYLTGGTALGRFYLNHRYSEDLDFFMNDVPDYLTAANRLRTALEKRFKTSSEKVIVSESFVRIWIPGKEELKIEMVNDVAHRWGDPIDTPSIPLDTVSNILANKLTAIVSRDEPKDVFDIVTIASVYSFNWSTVFEHAIQKSLLSENDVHMRLKSFPVTWLIGKDWLIAPVDSASFRKKLDTICFDFFYGNDNSLGQGKTPIEEAKPNEE